MKKYLVSTGITVVLAAFLYYFFLPAMNVHSFGFWMYLLVVLGAWTVSFIGCAAIEEQTDKAPINNKGIGTVMTVSIVLTCIPLLVMIIGGISSMKIFHAKQYSSIITVENAVFAEDMPETTSVSNIALMDTASAAIIGNRTLGSLSEVVSQYEISGQYSQINYKGVPKKVAELEYAGFFKWLNNRGTGIPGYVMVDPVKNTAEYVKLTNTLKYTDSACFGEDLWRRLRFEYPTKILYGSYFEIDEEGNPYYIVSCASYHAGLFGAEDISEVIIFNPCDGSSQIYSVEDVPSWVDIVYTGYMASDKYNWYGTLQRGYWNSVVGNVDCKQTTDDFGYITIGDDVWYFTGVTSVGGDESNIGFIISNARTGEYKFYQIAGAEEYSAMSAAEGEVQEKGYEASFPSLVNVAGQATYIMVLKDAGGLVKLYALVNVENYGYVATGTTQAEALKAYRKLLSSKGVGGNAAAGESDSITITVENVRIVDMENTPVVYITAENGNVYKGFLNLDESLILVREGDQIKVEFTETEVAKIYQIESWE